MNMLQSESDRDSDNVCQNGRLCFLLPLSLSRLSHAHTHWVFFYLSHPPSALPLPLSVTLSSSPPTLCIFLSSLLPLSLSPTSSLTHSLSHFPSLSSFPRTHIVYFSISVTPLSLTLPFSLAPLSIFLYRSPVSCTLRRLFQFVTIQLSTS